MSSDKPDVWFPLVVGDYLKDTSRLTTEQHGAYMLLLMDYWTKGPPPNDDTILASIAKLDPRRWRVHRPTLEPFFQIGEGLWRHKRVEKELARWAEKKRLYIERASAGGRAKAAKSTASSTFQALLKSCSSSASTEVDGLADQSTLCGQNGFLGPQEVRDEFVSALGSDWVTAYLDPCTWQDVPERALIPANGYAARKIIRDARAILAKLNLTVLERAA